MDNLIRTGELLISDGAHSVDLCCQIEHTHPCPLKMSGADCSECSRVLPTRNSCSSPLKALYCKCLKFQQGEEALKWHKVHLYDLWTKLTSCTCCTRL